MISFLLENSLQISVLDNRSPQDQIINTQLFVIETSISFNEALEARNISVGRFVGKPAGKSQ